MPSNVDPASERAATGWFSSLVWVAMIAAGIVYGIWLNPIERLRTAQDREHYENDYPQTFLGMACEHWALVATIGIITLIVAGRLGADLGLPGLFRDPPSPHLTGREAAHGGPGRSRDQGMGATFWGALGATLLVAIVWTAIYFSEIIHELGQFHSEHLTHSHPWTVALGTGFADHGDLLLFLALCCPPFLGYLLLAELLPARAPGVDRREHGRTLADFGYFLMGMLTGCVVVYMATKSGNLLHGALVSAWKWIYRHRESVVQLPFGSPIRLGRWALGLLKIEEIHPHASTAGKAAIMGAYTAFALTAGAVFTALTQFRRSHLSPGLAIALVLIIAALAISVASTLSTTGQAVGLLFVGLVYLAVNGNAYKYRFPGLLELYPKAKRIDVSDLSQSDAIQAEELGLLDNKEVLAHWRGYIAKHRGLSDEQKPKLVLVATTGGAYRAAFWTTVVLDELEREMPGFSRHIRLLTGASGGMVGAAYFAASMAEEPFAKGPETESLTDRLREETGLDSLTPIMRRLVSRDLPQAFWPWTQGNDRGVELERTWESLGRPFADLHEGEYQGWRPSLIVSPMVVETGRRLLISNLSLSGLAECRPETPGPNIPGPDPGGKVDRLLSRPAVEFFRVFRDMKPGFKLATAIRMSATFPYASPAVSLPTVPPRRVVDAGYYDVYGVDIATSWLHQHRRWIRDNTSGAALVQIRASPIQIDDQAHLAVSGRPGSENALVNRIATSLEALTSPIEGGLSALGWSMRFRNAGQVRSLQDYFDDGNKPDFFETFSFENSTRFAMNWFLSDIDIEEMRRSIGAPPGPTVDRKLCKTDRVLETARQRSQEFNVVQKDRLIRWFGDGA